MKKEDIVVEAKVDARGKFSHIALCINGREREVPIRFLRVSEARKLEDLLRETFGLGLLCAAESADKWAELSKEPEVAALARTIRKQAEAALEQWKGGRG